MQNIQIEITNLAKVEVTNLDSSSAEDNGYEKGVIADHLDTSRLCTRVLGESRTSRTRLEKS